MKQCCRDKAEAVDEFWRDLVDAISMRHGYTEPVFETVRDQMDAHDWAAAKVIAKLERRPMGEVVCDAIAYAYPPTKEQRKAEEERVWREELVPLGVLMGLIEPQRELMA